MSAAASIMQAIESHTVIRRPFRASSRPLPRSVVAASALHTELQSQAPAATTRRSLLAGAAALVVLAGPSAAALAASRTQLFTAYYDKTEEVFHSIQRVLDLEPSEEGYAAKVDKFRDEANAWVADYRRTMSVGRKSFAETYAVVSTLLGFYTARGPEGGKLPAKVRAQAEKKLESARAALEREKTKSGGAPAPSDRGRL